MGTPPNLLLTGNGRTHFRNRHFTIAYCVLLYKDLARLGTKNAKKVKNQLIFIKKTQFFEKTVVFLQK
jgi:hypothetical protein